jgi:hypothetical protein
MRDLARDPAYARALAQALDLATPADRRRAAQVFMETAFPAERSWEAALEKAAQDPRTSKLFVIDSMKSLGGMREALEFGRRVKDLGPTAAVVTPSSALKVLMWGMGVPVVGKKTFFQEDPATGFCRVPVQDMAKDRDTGPWLSAGVRLFHTSRVILDTAGLEDLHLMDAVQKVQIITRFLQARDPVPDVMRDKLLDFLLRLAQFA